MPSVVASGFDASQDVNSIECSVVQSDYDGLALVIVIAPIYGSGTANRLLTDEPDFTGLASSQRVFNNEVGYSSYRVLVYRVDSGVGYPTLEWTSVDAHDNCALAWAVVDDSDVPGWSFSATDKSLTSLTYHPTAAHPTSTWSLRPAAGFIANANLPGSIQTYAPITSGDGISPFVESRGGSPGPVFNVDGAACISLTTGWPDAVSQAATEIALALPEIAATISWDTSDAPEARWFVGQVGTAL